MSGIFATLLLSFLTVAAGPRRIDSVPFPRDVTPEELHAVAADATIDPTVRAAAIRYLDDTLVDVDAYAHARDFYRRLMVETVEGAAQEPLAVAATARHLTGMRLVHDDVPAMALALQHRRDAAPAAQRPAWDRAIRHLQAVRASWVAADHAGRTADLVTPDQVFTAVGAQRRAAALEGVLVQVLRDQVAALVWARRHAEAQAKCLALVRGPASAFTQRVLQLCITTIEDQGDPQRTVERFLVSFAPEDPILPQAKLAAAIYLYEQRAYAAARALLEALLAAHAADIDVAHARLTIALCHIRAGDHGAARRLLEQVLRESPGRFLAPRALFLLGWIHVYADDTPAARRFFERIERDYPDSEYAPKAREMLASIGAR